MSIKRAYSQQQLNNLNFRVSRATDFSRFTPTTPDVDLRQGGTKKLLLLGYVQAWPLMRQAATAPEQKFFLLFFKK
jgi:hypothetical protein